MTVELYKELVNRLRKQDVTLTDGEIAQVAEQAVKLGDAEVQQATVFHPNAGVEMARIYMKMAENPANVIYGLRLQLAEDSKANPCTLKTLAWMVVEFNDKEMGQRIAANPAATSEVKEILNKR